MAWQGLVNAAVDTVGALGSTYVNIAGARANLENARAANRTAPPAAVAAESDAAPPAIIQLPGGAAQPVVVTAPAAGAPAGMDSGMLLLLAFGAILLFSLKK